EFALFSNPWRRTRGDWNPLRSGHGTSMAQRILDFLQADPHTFGDDARLWTYPELASWVSVLKSKGLLQRGAKTRIAEQKKDTGLTSTSELLDLFEREAFLELAGLHITEYADANEGQRAVLRWWYDRLLDARKRIADFPVKIVERSGVKELQEEPRCYVGSVHSFKGAEADVTVIFPDVSPAGWREWRARGTARDGVVRLFYVALTRCRDTMIVCDPAGQGVNLMECMN
ncbi:unnamed protein product, partial [marine sediment metagenome]